ncbi:MAG TPA: NAD(P)/FAD-dependent oxidoreductase [Flavobacteriaceae bacterium]|nr:NAD(P)/FAD-dependent oxidoreductase [Flavobacteriaceae bacterium]
MYDSVIIGSGPNGLSAGIALAQKGLNVLIIEAASSVGGGTRTAELTLPGFHHDVCSAVHPMAYASPFLKELPLEEYGLEWIFPEASAAHPLDDEKAVLLYKSIDETARNLGVDSKKYKKTMTPFADKAEELLADSLKPLGWPKNPGIFLRFGLQAFQPAAYYANHIFKGERAKALFAGCAAHSILPFNKFFSTAIGLMLITTGHIENWPIAKGGSENIAIAMSSYFKSLGGEIKVSTKIDDFLKLPEAKKYIFDTDPRQLANIAGKNLSNPYKNKLYKFRYGPGVFKIDYALNEPIPWKDPRCLKASTVHVGGSIDEIKASEKTIWKGKHSKKPFVLVGQQSLFDESRAPSGKHTGWAYCHVPHGSQKDMTPYIENQIERFAPGFKDIILAKHTMNTTDLHAYNPNYLGGAITGGSSDIFQLFSRPVNLFNPYATSNPNIYICSASTPPGGGVHGMCGYHAAKSVLNSLAVE